MEQKVRIKNSFGTCHVHEGELKCFSEEKYEIDYTRKFYLFDIIPMGAVRMTQSDKWKTNPNHLDPNKRQRKCVAEYFAWKNLISLQANQMNYELKDTLDAVYLVPMPNSWSEKKKQRMNGLPCKVKPDTDNITKAVKDALKKQDSEVWYEKAEKRWAFKGSILIYG